MSAKQRIAFLCHAYHRGGVTRWMADAAIAFAGKGYEVFFVTVVPAHEFISAGGREQIISLLRNYTSIMQVISCKVDFTFEFGTEEYRASIYKRLVAANVPAGTPVIVSDDSSVWHAAAAIADKYPMIGVLHGDQDVYYDQARKYQEQLSLGICVSGRIKRTALTRCDKIDPQKIYTIPCGIVLPPFAPSTPEDGILRLIFIGRLTDYEKRAEDLVKISTLLRKNGVTFHLDIIGNSAESAIEFGNSFKENGVADAVSFHGWLTKPVIQQHLDRSDILLLTSNSEGMPLVMMEALASGCAFTGTRVSGIEDYEHDPQAADCLSVYTVGDIEDAVKKIRKVAAIPRHTRQQAARSLAEADFSIEVCIDRYAKAMNTICSALPQPRPIKLSAIDVLYSKAISVMRFMKVSMWRKK